MEADSDGAGGAEAQLQWETVRERVIKAGSLERLVESLFLPDACYDARQFNVFFATYRALAEPWDVLRTLLSLYDAALTGQRQAVGKSDGWRCALRDSIRTVLGFWLEAYPEDFREPPRYPCLTELAELARLHSPHLAELLPKVAKAKSPPSRQNGLNGLSAVIGEGGKRSESLEPLDYILSPGRVRTPDVAKMNPRYVAEQLTYWDAELFRRLVPWQCTARFWGRRRRSGREAEAVASVTATVHLFNALSSRLQTSLIHPPNTTPHRRAAILSNWIAVARELRSLKNFSSLRSVLSGLQSEPVHRLKASWALVPRSATPFVGLNPGVLGSRDEKDEFDELAAVFGGSQDVEQSGGGRAVLEAEGTGKTSSRVDDFLAASALSRGASEDDDKGHSNHSKHHPQPRPHRRARSDVGAEDRRVSSGGGGTVPYLGSFLTDLTFIDEALPDTVKADPGDPESPALLNFEKRRREFQVLAQLKLFQSAARQYQLKPDPAFADWFSALPSLPDKVRQSGLALRVPWTPVGPYRTVLRDRRRWNLPRQRRLDPPPHPSRRASPASSPKGTFIAALPISQLPRQDGD